MCVCVCVCLCVKKYILPFKRKTKFLIMIFLNSEYQFTRKTGNIRNYSNSSFEMFFATSNNVVVNQIVKIRRDTL